MPLNKETGNTGEQLAVSYFADRAYKILHTNWRFRHFEVDIIACKDDVLYFIEVKSRRSAKYGWPEDNVSRKKIKHLIDASDHYLYIHPQWKRMQFDVLSIIMEKGKAPEYFLIEDVYL